VTLTILGSAAASFGGLLAQAPSGGGAAPSGTFALGQFAPILIIIAVFYFLLIRPQQKRQRELQDWMKSMKKGDEIVTTGGIWGKVAGISDNSPYVTLELQEKVRIRVLRSHIAGKAPSNDAAGMNAPEAK
jgi:preprotein translocase subunit YajC